jgi:hypothetical protein
MRRLKIVSVNRRLNTSTSTAFLNKGRNSGHQYAFKYDARQWPGRIDRLVRHPSYAWRHQPGDVQSHFTVGVSRRHKGDICGKPIDNRGLYTIQQSAPIYRLDLPLGDWSRLFRDSKDSNALSGDQAKPMRLRRRKPPAADQHRHVEGKLAAQAWNAVAERRRSNTNFMQPKLYVIRGNDQVTS